MSSSDTQDTRMSADSEGDIKLHFNPQKPNTDQKYFYASVPPSAVPFPFASIRCDAEPLDPRSISPTNNGALVKFSAHRPEEPSGTQSFSVQATGLARFTVHFNVSSSATWGTGSMDMQMPSIRVQNEAQRVQDREPSSSSYALTRPYGSSIAEDESPTRRISLNRRQNGSVDFGQPVFQDTSHAFPSSSRQSATQLSAQSLVDGQSPFPNSTPNRNVHNLNMTPRTGETMVADAGPSTSMYNVPRSSFLSERGSAFIPERAHSPLKTDRAPDNMRLSVPQRSPFAPGPDGFDQATPSSGTRMHGGVQFGDSRSDMPISPLRGFGSREAQGSLTGHPSPAPNTFERRQLTEQSTLVPGQPMSPKFNQSTYGDFGGQRVNEQGVAPIGRASLEANIFDNGSAPAQDAFNLGHPSSSRPVSNKFGEAQADGTQSNASLQTIPSHAPSDVSQPGLWTGQTPAAYSTPTSRRVEHDYLLGMKVDPRSAQKQAVAMPSAVDYGRGSGGENAFTTGQQTTSQFESPLPDNAQAPNRGPFQNRLSQNSDPIAPLPNSEDPFTQGSIEAIPGYAENQAHPASHEQTLVYTPSGPVPRDSSAEGQSFLPRQELPSTPSSFSLNRHSEERERQDSARIPSTTFNPSLPNMPQGQLRSESQRFVSGPSSSENVGLPTQIPPEPERSPHPVPSIVSNMSVTGQRRDVEGTPTSSHESLFDVGSTHSSRHSVVSPQSPSSLLGSTVDTSRPLIGRGVTARERAAGRSSSTARKNLHQMGLTWTSVTGPSFSTAVEHIPAVPILPPAANSTYHTDENKRKIPHRVDRESTGGGPPKVVHLANVVAHPGYENFSPEEIRWSDYQRLHKQLNANVSMLEASTIGDTRQSTRLRI